MNNTAEEALLLTKDSSKPSKYGLFLLINHAKNTFYTHQINQMIRFGS